MGDFSYTKVFFYFFFSLFKMSLQKMAARAVVPTLKSATSSPTSAVPARTFIGTKADNRKGKGEKVLLKTVGASFLFFSSIELYLQSRSAAMEKLEQRQQRHAEKQAQFALRGNNHEHEHDHDHDDGHEKKKKWAPRG